ncbi:TOG array regulator of axonemal microtubules protein 2-like [Hirundo rustica]|uniref:TOG array regulator of axonemal microtubules protein 2-like n=1 Tax=Hirundo rustica TaxID=43150 RepID=UPI001A93F163|nr:TOG array regulator of axonemal microtubules protein 2-like [Hirundo rustica]
MPLFPRKLADLFELKTYVQNPGLGNGGLGSRPAQGALAREPRQRQLSSAAPRADAEEDKVKAEHGSASPRGFPWSQAKEMGHSTCPGVTRYEDLRDVFEKGTENQKGEQPSVKKPEKRNDGSKKPQAALSSSKRVKSTSDGHLLQRAKAQVTLPPAVEETEPLQKLYHLLEAKGFQTRMEGVALFLDLCKTSPQLISANIVRIHAALYKLAQEKLDQKYVERCEEEIKKRSPEKTSLQLPPQTADPGHAAEESFSLPPVNGTASGVQRKHPGSALKEKVLRKRDNVPLLSNTPIIHGDGNFPHKLPSVTSQTATGAKRPEEPLHGHGQKDTASSDPQQSLLKALSLLRSDDWELKEKGLFSIKHLAGSHSEVLFCRLRDICRAVTSEVTNLRSKVSYSAIVALGELFATFKKDMDSEVDGVARVLLQTVWNSPEFVQEAATQTLGMMVANVTPARAMTALMDSGLQSRHVQVRKCAAELLLSLMEKIGVTELASTPMAERLVHRAGKLAQDCDKDTRHYAQEMVKMLLNHEKLKRLLEQSVSTRDLEDIMTRIKKKGTENQKGEQPSVKKPEKRNDGSKKPQAALSSSKRVKSTSDGHLLQRAKAQVTLPPAVEETEPLQKLYHLLEAKGFQTRMEGVALFLDLCKTSPQLISANIVRIFDYFVLRIADSHKKVKQKALDVLAEIIGILEDALNPVIIGLVEGIIKNLNSKDPGVHTAAVKALEESIAHLDKVALMKEFSHRWSKLSGQALLDVTERITVLVEWVYPRSPEVIQHYVLPVLWSSLENKALPVRSTNVRTVVTKLASALYKVMGTKLKKRAASQPPHVRENLSSILGW